jgi:hypothetical protein
MEAIGLVNNYIDQLHDRLNNEKIKKIFNIIKYADHVGIYLRYKCGDNDGFIISKFPYAHDGSVDIQICIVPVDKCKEPKNFLMKFFEVPSENDNDETYNRVENYLLENSNMCEV